MKSWIGRLVLAIWFVGMVVVVVRGMPVQGQGEPVRRYLPLMLKEVMVNGEAPLYRYIAVGVSGSYGNGEIFTVRADGSEATRLTNNTIHDGQPRFSPDGQQIAFVQRDFQDTLPTARVMVMNRDGSALRPLLADSFYEVYFEWSPDGRWILVSGRFGDADTAHTLLKVAPDGSEVDTILAEGADPTQWGWSPDGAYLHYGRYEYGNSALWVMGTTQNMAVRISDAVLQVAWHPDGREFFVREKMQGTTEAGRMVTPDGSTSRLLYTGEYRFVEWVLQEQFLLLQNGHTYNLATVARTGGMIEPITDYPSGVDVGIGAISPDGSMVLYSTYDEVSERRLYLHTLDGEVQDIMDICLVCTLSVVSWAEDQSGVIYSITYHDRVSLDSVFYLPLHNGATGVPREFDVSGSGWVFTFLPASARYGFTQKGGYPPPQPALPRRLDTTLMEMTVLPGVPEPFEYNQWRYLP